MHMPLLTLSTAAAAAAAATSTLPVPGYTQVVLVSLLDVAAMDGMCVIACSKHLHVLFTPPKVLKKLEHIKARGLQRKLEHEAAAGASAAGAGSAKGNPEDGADAGQDMGKAGAGGDSGKGSSVGDKGRREEEMGSEEGPGEEHQVCGQGRAYGQG